MLGGPSKHGSKQVEILVHHHNTVKTLRSYIDLILVLKISDLKIAYEGFYTVWDQLSRA